jgi:hypothetical protein
VWDEVKPENNCFTFYAATVAVYGTLDMLLRVAGDRKWGVSYITCGPYDYGKRWL